MSVEHARRVRGMFGRIIPRYDLLNRLMSLGMDRRWRRLAAAAARPSGGLALDLGTGTGELALELRRQGAAHVVGADFLPDMLRRLRLKAASAGEANVSCMLADALRLPFPEGTFDCVTSAFLLRNLAELRTGLSEMGRVLRPGGRLVCLDMTQPPPGPFGALYRLYFDRLLPPLAGAISGDRDAYRYLPKSLVGFPRASELAALMVDVGLTQVRVRRLGGGAVALHAARRPLDEGRRGRAAAGSRAQVGQSRAGGVGQAGRPGDAARELLNDGQSRYEGVKRIGERQGEGTQGENQGNGYEPNNKGILG